MTQTNPFLSAPFPGAGGDYRFDGKKLHDEKLAAQAATDEPAETENVADKTTKAGTRRPSR